MSILRIRQFKRRKKGLSTGKKKMLMIDGVLLLLIFLGMGFSALATDLGIIGDVQLKKYEAPTLYNVMKNYAEEGTYAKEYTGAHQDSMAGVGNEKIYHWYAPDTTAGNTLATEILDKNNVIFADHCWQMIRTTDTGGVKMIYNGVPSNGQCNNTGAGQQIGTSSFNNNTGDSFADFGYMYNTRYTTITKNISDTVLFRTANMVGTTRYYYGTGVNYSNGSYTLTGTTQDTWTNIYASSAGLYTCKSDTETTCSTVYYIVGGTSSNIYTFNMTNGNLLDYYNTNLVLGTSYEESNGIYTLKNTTTIRMSDWYDNYRNYNKYYTCGDNRTSCTDLRHISNVYNNRYYNVSSNDLYVYANDFTYDNNNDTYTLNSDRMTTWDLADSTTNENLTTHHYTCWNTTGECTTVSYVYSYSYYAIYYININNGKSVDDIIDEMLYNDDVNTIDSTIKTFIDTWYINNIASYDSYLEETIFCNDRNESNYDENGWNPNGGSFSKSFTVGGEKSKLKCSLLTDSFSISNNKAKLSYSIGLVSYTELYLMTNKNIFKTGVNYWEFGYASMPYVGYVPAAGQFGSAQPPSTNNGVRPVISLKTGTLYTSGDGSKNNPYIVE